MDELAERYRANLELLEAARVRLQSAVDSGSASDAERRRLATVKELLTPVTESALDAEGNVVAVQRPRQFLKVDVDGQGRAVEVLGDLRHAKNVAVLVPGMGNSLDTFRGQSDRGDLIRQEARPSETAVVVWLDYDSPQGLVQAASKDAALEGGPRLAEFLNELDGLKADGAEVTAVAHSYGTDVLGQALLDGGRAKRVVMTGSPGITKYVDEASDFVPPPTRLYVERAPGDYVAYSEWHGPDPATFPDAIRMATNDPIANDEAVSVHWHNEYYRPNSEALRNIGRVVRGDLASITTTDTSRSAETKLVLGTSWGGPLNAVAGAASKVYDGVVSLTKPSRASARAAASDIDAGGPGGGGQGGSGQGAGELGAGERAGAAGRGAVGSGSAGSGGVGPGAGQLGAGERTGTGGRARAARATGVTRGRRAEGPRR
ncbi:alpha/beta hydrolase [Kribbella pratensis]|uniref:Alpha/beta hydrolase family protein n=1 Tax=Kribbella pratensis TaxID=2512112 RepID=A0A4R8BUZ9_9ACTN|nr:alpha/beta hydrolase [Kribbella pratensis]TDW61071.1 alpha/beta hydrolase family protein [Kribbella pratensis]